MSGQGWMDLVQHGCCCCCLDGKSAHPADGVVIVGELLGILSVVELSPLRGIFQDMRLLMLHARRCRTMLFQKIN
ncbi:hypothetical protein BDQ94DRAFT_140744 [Aspergillus welwitschiae]|uniref:Uncharacterized protein n=1 Tax=Aspergillus welwitschiae TaxID=1341132 RepID=A0A3F3Q6D4_9EURO|nr:hypothetical protein BDQ94DRAFT_140744 [Aspergillus welwitschiae]RDH34685.1 hypothetical protein BDQ94DRAFT_140744 [Aspergillus welwitschiae]